MIKTYVIGRIGRDPEIRKAGDSQVMNVTIAANYGRKDSNGERPTQWIDASMWGDRAAKVQPFLTKGSQHAFFLDDTHIETYVKGDGSTGVKLAAVVSDVVLLPNGERKSAPAQRPDNRTADRSMPHKEGSGFDNMDDDIPW